MAPREVQEQVKRRKTQRIAGRDHGKPVTTLQIQGPKGLGPPCPPDALGQQGQEVAAPLLPPDSNGAGALQARGLDSLRSLSMEQ